MQQTKHAASAPTRARHNMILTEHAPSKALTELSASLLNILFTRNKVTMSGGEEMPSWFDILGGPDRLQVGLVPHCSEHDPRVIGSLRGAARCCGTWGVASWGCVGLHAAAGGSVAAAAAAAVGPRRR
jgi:hypothetical protein